MERRCKEASPRDALPVAPQYFLAATTRVPIAPAIAPHVNIDIPSAVSAPAVDINVDSRAPIGSVAAPSTVDVDVNVGALLAPTRSPFILRCPSTLSTTVATGRIRTLPAGVLATSTGSFLIALLDLQYCSLRADPITAGEDRRCFLSSYAEREYRRSGTEHQQVSHLNHPLESAPVSRQQNVRLKRRLRR
jgi:hypothetical protein